MDYSNLTEDNEIFNIYLKENPIPKGKQKEPYLILFDGIPGTGKSTVARLIFSKIDIIVLNSDKIRQFIYKTGFSKNFAEIQNLLKKIQYYRIKETLKNGNNCLLDGDISNDFETKIAAIKDFHYKYYIIKLVYDREKVIERIKKRSLDNEAISSINGSETVNYSNAGVDCFLRMEKDKYNIPKEYIYFEIDTSKDYKDIENQVDELIEKINKE